MNRLADEATQDEARCDAGAVGDRVGDVAAQGRQEQREGRLADDEEERPEVGHQPGVEQGVVEPERLGVGEVEEAVVDGDVAVGADDLVAAEQEAERDQQTARGDERDHVGDAGHQDPPDASTPRLLAHGVAPTARPRPPRAASPRDRRRSAAPRRSSRRRRRSGASRSSSPSACRRTGSGRARRRRRRRSPRRRGRSCRAAAAWHPPSPGSRPRCRPRRARRRPRAPRRPCRCGRCRSGRR